MKSTDIAGEIPQAVGKVLSVFFKRPGKMQPETVDDHMQIERFQSSLTEQGTDLRLAVIDDGAVCAGAFFGWRKGKAGNRHPQPGKPFEQL